MVFSPRYKEPASDQLSVVLKSTEDATHKIMDATEALQKLITETQTDQAVKDKVEALTAQIFEACNFQDITGQRITKVMNVLQSIEDEIQRLFTIFMSDENAKILHGPNDPRRLKETESQSDIDAIMQEKK